MQNEKNTNWVEYSLTYLPPIQVQKWGSSGSKTEKNSRGWDWGLHRSLMWSLAVLPFGAERWKGAVAWLKPDYTSQMDIGWPENWRECCLPSRAQPRRPGVLIQHGAWAEDMVPSNGWEWVHRWSDQPWEPVHPSVQWRKPLAFPSFPPKKCRCGQKIAEREALQLRQEESQWCWPGNWKPQWGPRSCATDATGAEANTSEPITESARHPLLMSLERLPQEEESKTEVKSPTDHC